MPDAFWREQYMATYTRDEIKTAFISLLDERPFSKITVKDVVLKCGINRNTFYYYFPDLPALAEAVVAEVFVSIMQEKLTPQTIEECLDAIIRFAMEHRPTVLHLYRSTDRERFEISQWRVCDYVVEQYLNTVTEGRRISDEDRELLHDHLCSTFFGWVMDTLRSGLSQEVYVRFRRVCAWKRGHMEEILDRCEKEYKAF